MNRGVIHIPGSAAQENEFILKFVSYLILGIINRHFEIIHQQIIFQLISKVKPLSGVLHQFLGYIFEVLRL